MCWKLEILFDGKPHIKNTPLENNVNKENLKKEEKKKIWKCNEYLIIDIHITPEQNEYLLKFPVVPDFLLLTTCRGVA